MNDATRLRDALSDRAEDMAGTTLRFEDVRGRARSIRRRRTAAGGLAAAAVLAVAVPFGLSNADRLEGTGEVATSPTPVPTPSVSASASPSPSASPSAREVGLAAPQVPYALEGRIHLPGGDVLTVRDEQGRELGTSQSGAVLDDGFVMLAYEADGLFYSLLGPDGVRIDTWDTSGEVQEAPAWGERLRPLAGGGLATVEAGSSVPLPGLSEVSGVAADGRYAAIVARRQDTSVCSAVFAADGSEAWRTCSHQLGMFSPDGRYLVGRPPISSGLGDASVAILDARTGEVLAELERTDAESRAGAFLASGSVWQADGSLLVQSFDGDHWGLLRLTTDGEVAAVAEPDLSSYTDETAPPLALLTP